MPRVPIENIQQLKDGGIFVSKPYPEKHAFPSGHALMPADSEDFRNSADEIIKSSDFESPTEPGIINVYGGPHLLWIYGVNNKWYILCHHYCPGPGPGDFIDEWDTIEEAVEDALKYFGKDDRWQLIEKIRRYHKYRLSEESFAKIKGAGLKCRGIAGIEGYRIAKTEILFEPPEKKDMAESGYQARVFTDEEYWYSEFTAILPLEAETEINKWTSPEEAVDDAIDFFQNRQGKNC